MTAPVLARPPRRLLASRTLRTAAPLVLLALIALLSSVAALTSQAMPDHLAESRDPLASLAAAAPSRRWDLAFWTGQEAGGTGLWRRAVRICRGRGAGAYPNCTTVRLASWWGPAAPPPPVALLSAPAAPAPRPGSGEGRR